MAAPVRTCVGCRTKRPQSELVRVIRRSDGTLEAGRTLPGRGAWLCAAADGSIDSACFERARKRKALGRALRAPVREH